MVFFLTVLKSVRDASSVPSIEPGSRKGVPMRRRTHRMLRLLRGSMLETVWAIGASYGAGALPA